MKKHREGYGCIYSAIHLPKDLEYVGKDKTGDPINHRWKAHRKAATKAHPKGYFQRAIKSAGGPEAFMWMVIWRGPLEQMNEKERYYIKKRHTFVGDPLCRGYNLTLGGDGFSGKHSKKTKRQMSAAQLHRFEDPIERERISIATLSRWEDQAEHEKASAAALHRWESLTEHKKACIAQTKRRTDPVDHENAVIMQLQRYEDPLEHEKTSVAGKRRFENPVECAKHLASHQTDEFRKLKAENTTAFFASMTPEERKAYWHATHPNGNGWPRPKAK